MAVGIVTCSCTDYRMDGVANGIVDCEVYHQIVETAVWGTKVLSVNTLMVVRAVILTTHGRAS